MENPTSILLYSKYSPNSKQITELIQSSPVPLQFKYLCVDNEEVRQRIKENKKIKVNYLPCILNVYSNGGVEQFEGPQAFNAVHSILASLPPPIPYANQIPSPEPIEDYSDPAEPPPAPKQRVVRRRPAPIQRPKQRHSEPEPHATSIDDLPMDDDDDDDDDDHLQAIRKPKRRIRADKGNYVEVSSDDDSEYHAPEHNLQGLREVRKNTESNIKDQQSDVAAKAQELAKQREEADQRFKPRGAGIPPDMRRE